MCPPSPAIKVSSNFYAKEIQVQEYNHNINTKYVSICSFNYLIHSDACQRLVIDEVEKLKALGQKYVVTQSLYSTEFNI